MTRVVVYSAGFVAFIAATAMTLAAIHLPKWVSFTSPITTDDHVTYTYGLHRVCLSLNNSCRPFPESKDCISGEEGHFCSLWRSTGFLMNFAAVFELVTIVAYLVILAGGKQKRERGWKLLAVMLFVTGLAQCAAMALVAYTFDNYDRFVIPGFTLDTSWILCTVSWIVAILSAIGIIISAFIFPPEDGYEFIG